MPRRPPPPKTALIGAYLTKRELVTLVPLSLSTIDRLEQRGAFPRRFVIEPTTRVVWKRSEVEKFMEQRAAKRVHV